MLEHLYPPLGRPGFSVLRHFDQQFNQIVRISLQLVTLIIINFPSAISFHLIPAAHIVAEHLQIHKLPFGFILSSKNKNHGKSVIEEKQSSRLKVAFAGSTEICRAT